MSVRDATHDPVFPQPPLLSSGAIEVPRSATVVCAPNPGTFTCNGVRVTACTQDVLRHLSAAEARPAVTHLTHLAFDDCHVRRNARHFAS